MSKWISVKDKLPEMETDVLLYWDVIDHIENGKFFRDGMTIYHSLFDGESLSDQPTHWIPLPEPPCKN